MLAEAECNSQRTVKIEHSLMTYMIRELCAVVWFLSAQCGEHLQNIARYVCRGWVIRWFDNSSVVEGISCQPSPLENEESSRRSCNFLLCTGHWKTSAALQHLSWSPLALCREIVIQKYCHEKFSWLCYF